MPIGLGPPPQRRPPSNAPSRTGRRSRNPAVRRSAPPFRSIGPSPWEPPMRFVDDSLTIGFFWIRHRVCLEKGFMPSDAHRPSTDRTAARARPAPPGSSPEARGHTQGPPPPHTNPETRPTPSRDGASVTSAHTKPQGLYLQGSGGGHPPLFFVYSSSQNPGVFLISRNRRSSLPEWGGGGKFRAVKIRMEKFEEL